MRNRFVCVQGECRVMCLGIVRTTVSFQAIRRRQSWSTAVRAPNLFNRISPPKEKHVWHSFMSDESEAKFERIHDFDFAVAMYSCKPKQTVCSRTEKKTVCVYNRKRSTLCLPNLKFTLYFDMENNRKKNKRHHFDAFPFAIARFHSRCLVVLLLLKLLMTLCVRMRWRFSPILFSLFFFVLSVFVYQQSTLFALRSSLFYLLFIFFMYFSICTSMGDRNCHSQLQINFDFDFLELPLIPIACYTFCLFRRERDKKRNYGESKRNRDPRLHSCGPS